MTDPGSPAFGTDARSHERDSAWRVQRVARGIHFPGLRLPSASIYDADGREVSFPVGQVPRGAIRPAVGIFASAEVLILADGAISCAKRKLVDRRAAKRDPRVDETSADLGTIAKPPS